MATKTDTVGIQEYIEAREQAQNISGTFFVIFLWCDRFAS